MFENVINESLNLAFKKAIAKSDSVRQSLHQDMAGFFYNDYEEICRVLEEDTLNNPYSADTIVAFKHKFSHRDHIRKIVKKITAGVYTQRPIRKLLVSDDVEDENFAQMLQEINYHDAVQEAFEAANFFNIAFVNPVFEPVTKCIRLDVITPESVKCESTQSDYLKLEKIAIRKCYGDEIRYTVWTPTEHFIKDENGNSYVIGNNTNMINPYSPEIPVSVLRMRKGQDFYGEPNWNLYLFQKDFDISLTDKKLAEQRITHQAWLAINLGLSANESISPGKIFNIEYRNADMPAPSLESITSNYDFQSLRENAEWDYKNTVISQGISASNVSTEVDDLSGIAKIVDNAELIETRMDKMNKLYDFEIDLMSKIRMVANANGMNFSEEGKFHVEFIPDPTTETADEKNARRESEKKYFIANEIDFVIQDLELNSREEAIEHIKLRQEEMALLKMEQSDIMNNQDIQDTQTQDEMQAGDL